MVSEYPFCERLDFLVLLMLFFCSHCRRALGLTNRHVEVIHWSSVILQPKICNSNIWVKFHTGPMSLTTWFLLYDSEQDENGIFSNRTSGCEIRRCQLVLCQADQSQRIFFLQRNAKFFHKKKLSLFCNMFPLLFIAQRNLTIKQIQ